MVAIMRLRPLLTAALTAALVVPAAADGAARLSLKVADKHAAKAAKSTARTYSDDGVRVASFDLAACERAARLRADCEVTYELTDGSACDDVLHVTRGRRGKITVKADSGSSANRVFDDCTEPENEDAEELDVPEEGADDDLEGSLPVSVGAASDDDDFPELD
jgi:hypothetical protein